MIPAGYATYTRVVATTVENKEDILVILYENLLTEMKKARMGIEDRNPKVKGESLSKAFSIITELDCALDNDAGGDIAENLSILYHYVMDRLTVANIKYDLAALDEAEEVLIALNDGFKDAVSQHKSSGTMTSVARDAQFSSSGRLSVAV
ncbi:flagellar export chaperone FliS [Desulfocicer niacini]